MEVLGTQKLQVGKFGKPNEHDHDLIGKPTELWINPLAEAAANRCGDRHPLPLVVPKWRCLPTDPARRRDLAMLSCCNAQSHSKLASPGESASAVGLLTMFQVVQLF